MHKRQSWSARLTGVTLAACLAALSAPVFAQEERGPEDKSPTARDGENIGGTRDLNDGPIAPPGPGEPFTSGSRRGAANAEPPNVLVLLAHPDDELPFAPVLSRIAREGGNVTIVFATSGDVGPGVSGMEPGQALATLREDEGRCASFALGVPEPIYWQLGDGELATMARGPDSAARDMTQRTKDLIAIEAPDIIMTWGPDGGYGHADHRMISAIATQVVQAMGEDRPELLYLAFSNDAGAPPQGFEAWARLDPSLITDSIRYEIIDLDATRIAVDCYQSQFDETARAFLPQLLHNQIWRGQVQFRAAFPGPKMGGFVDRPGPRRERP